MRRAKFLIAILCFGLTAPTCALWPDTAHVQAVTPASADELIEAPADATAYVELGAGGHALLASSARLRLSTVATNNDQPAMLAATVLNGDVFIKLPRQMGAVVQAGTATFVAARGVFFHAAVREGRGVFDASDKAALELGNWAIKLPPAAASSGNWGISLPRAITISAPTHKPLERMRLDLTARARPIGSITSLGALLINEQLTPRNAVLWGNELIQAPATMGTTATLDELGQVTLASGARARLMAHTSGTMAHDVLAATLLEGSATFKLQPEVAACVQAAGATFVAARGARFRVLIVEGRAVIDAASDNVMEMGAWPLGGLNLLPGLMAQVGQGGQQPLARRYFVRPVGLNSNLVVRARSTRQIQVRVTDENDDPVRGAPVIFLLSGASGKSLGVLGATTLAAATGKVFTDAQGIASITFTAGAEPAAGTISATVEGTDASWIGQINLVKVVPGFWSPQNLAPMAITAAAAGVAIGVGASVSKDDQVPVQPSGGPVIKP
jgi:hypothetical protein